MSKQSTIPFYIQMRTVRAFHGLTQIDLGKAANIPPFLISCLECNKVLPTPDQERAIKQALGWTKKTDEGLAIIAAGNGDESKEG